MTILREHQRKAKEQGGGYGYPPRASEDSQRVARRSWLCSASTKGEPKRGWVSLYSLSGELRGNPPVV